jgi:NTP pyrophosphatase (non-canonical NTP hydrolase)
MKIYSEYFSDSITREEKKDIIYYLRKHNSEINEKEVEKILTDKYCNNDPRELYLVIINYDSNKLKDMNIAMKRHLNEDDDLISEVVYKIDYLRDNNEGEYMKFEFDGSFNNYQEMSRKTALYMEKVNELYPTISEEAKEMIAMGYVSSGLGEVGEIQGKIKKLIRDKGGQWTEEDKNEVMKEAGDVAWYLARLADLFDFALEDAAYENLKKLYSRMERGKIQGSGDNR